MTPAKKINVTSNEAPGFLNKKVPPANQKAKKAPKEKKPARPAGGVKNAAKKPATKKKGRTPKAERPEVEAFAKIRVIGVGGSGNNAINHMVQSRISGVDFIATNTDAQALKVSKAKKKIHIGKAATRGLGTGMNPELGKQSAEETREELQDALKNSDMVFVTCGMGGGTGTGAAPVVAKIARETGALTIGIVTRPFSFEGKQRGTLAHDGIEALKQEVDALITIPNDKILATVARDTSVQQAFAACDDILKQAVEGIADIITTPGIINVDFADIRAVMSDAGSALMGIGVATGENRAKEAAELAITSPLLDVSIHGATGVLFAIAGGDDMTMMEIQEAAELITESVDSDAKIIFGAINDAHLRKGAVKVTVIATGFPAENDSLEVPTPRTENTIGGFFGRATEEVPHDAKNVDDTIDRITSFNGEVGPVRTTVVPKKSEGKPTPVAKKDESDDDDWGAIPSFLRRSKLK